MHVGRGTVQIQPEVEPNQLNGRRSNRSRRNNRRMAPLRDLLAWTDRLVGLEPERVERSLATIDGWSNDFLRQQLVRPRTIDDVVRAVLLTDSIDRLTERGAPRNKLLSKLRDYAQFEAVWAEIRCAGVLAETSDDDVRVQLERGRAQGAHADVTLLFPEGPPYGSVEIKAVGLSDSEVEFCQRMNPSLDEVIPPFGMVSINAPLGGKPPHWTPQHVAHARMDAARAAAGVPNYPHGMAAATIVARGAEEGYIRRAASRIYKAVRQLPATDECWVALYWTNGAPVKRVIAALDWNELPAHVIGLMFIGGVVAFPHRNIDVFVTGVPRGADSSSNREFQSALDDGFAETVLDRTEASAGVRATLVRGVIRGKRRQVLRRDGSERLPPFNLILDRDPEEVAQAGSR